MRKILSDSTDSNKGISETLENAECYITDAEGFLRQASSN